MKSNPTFTVIIPSYNRAKLLPHTLDSVLEQIFFDFEIIVVDDGSTDNTAEAVKPFLADSRVNYFRIENSERGAARNFGVSKSTGRYITFLDSDDIFLPEHLKIASEKIIKTDHPPVFHLAYEILHLDGRVDQLPSLPSPVNEKLLEGNFLSCMGVFLRKDVALKNPFDEDRDLAGSEDYELWLRIGAQMPILTFKEVTSRLINHDGRSVITVNSKKLIQRIEILDQKLRTNSFFQEKFGSRSEKFGSYRTLYLSLHLALSGERWLAFKSLLLTVYLYPYVVFTYRFAVALKKIVLW